MTMEPFIHAVSINLHLFLIGVMGALEPILAVIIWKKLDSRQFTIAHHSQKSQKCLRAFISRVNRFCK